MRLRQLGHGQSFKYFAPPEVDQRIRALIPRHTPTTVVAAVDVLRWVITQTCAELVHNIPHWVKQGLEYADRRQAWDDLMHPSLENDTDVAKQWLQPDAKTLVKLYQPWTSFTTEEEARLAERHRERAFALLAMSPLAGLAAPTSSTSSIEEEQEREVDVEVEQERQVERPPKAQPAVHHLHPDVRSLIRNGRLSKDPNAFAATYAALASVISAPTERSAWTENLVATRDFLSTVAGVSKLDSAQYIRPVHWIVSLGPGSQAHRKVLVLLSPFEVNELLPAIRRSKNVQLHVYAPKIIQSRVSFDDLRFHTVPHPEIQPSPAPDVIMQLNLMAGQLYVPDFEVYAVLLDFLGVVNRSAIAAQELPAVVQGDGFVAPQHRIGRMRLLCKFKESPLPFVREVMGLRRKGASYLPTHLGKILSVSPLAEDDFIYD